MSSVPAPLRALESWTFERDGEALCMLRDPLGLAGEAGGLAMPASFLHVARRFDGRSDVDELASALSAPGRELGRETVAKVARYLSEQRCLEDASYDDAHAAALAEFRALHARPAIGAGLDYEADATELRIRVAGLVADDWDLPTPRGLTMALAPSCQLARGARLYSRTYAALRHASARFARVLLLAAAPSPLERALVPLAKA